MGITHQHATAVGHPVEIAFGLLLAKLSTIGPAIPSAGLFVVGAVGAVIAWQQAHTARTKLRLELFDKRKPIYDAARAFLGAVSTTGRVDRAELLAFLQASSEVRFLFSDHLADYLKMMTDRAYDVHLEEQLISGLPPGPSEARTHHVNKRSGHWKWIRSQYWELEHQFEPFMRIEQPLFGLRRRRVPAET